MADGSPGGLARAKIALFAALMRHAPGFRRIQQEHDRTVAALTAERDGLAVQVAGLQEGMRELENVRSERDALFRGIAMLLDERLPPGRA